MKQLTFLENAAINQLHKELSLLEKNNDMCTYANIYWRKNYGVFKHLPFHQTSDVYYFECSDENHLKTKLLFRPDITIFHKGEAKILIYVSELSDYEFNEILKFCGTTDVEIYKVDAFSILNRTKNSGNVTLNKLKY